MSSSGQIVGDIYPATFNAVIIDPPGSGIWRNVTNASGCYYAPNTLTYSFPAFALGIDSAPGCNTTLYSSANYNVIVVNKNPGPLGLTTQSCTDLYMGIYNFTTSGGKYENLGSAVRSLDYGPVGQFDSNIQCGAAQSSGTSIGRGSVPTTLSSSVPTGTSVTSHESQSASSSVATVAVTTRATSIMSGTASSTSPTTTTATTNAADSMTRFSNTWQWAVMLLAGSIVIGI